jgi:HK97 family phage major capsid protein
MLNTAQLERDLEAKKTAGLALLERTMQTAEAEDRAMTAEETAAIQKFTTEGQEIQATLARLKGMDGMREQLQKLTGGAGATGTGLARVDRRSMGQQYVEAAEVQEFFKAQGHRTSSAWRSPSTELYDYSPGGMHATTLTEDPASGGKLILPDIQPGILPILFRPLRIADLFAPGVTGSNLITYMRETLFTNAAATVAEGAAKPESALAFDAVSEAVRKIAHWLPVTEEMLEDLPAIRSYIDQRLRGGLGLTEESQLWNGDGVAPNLLGVTKRAGLAAAIAVGAAGASPIAADAIYLQITAIYTNSFLMPDGIVMNPANWATIALLKTTTGEYIGGGPFSQAANPTLWGLPVVPTPVQAAGTAWVGAFKQAVQLFRRGGIRVEASNSHQDYFIKNLVAIRAEERLALAVYRPGAIGSVTALTTFAAEAEDAPEGGGGGRRNHK